MLTSRRETRCDSTIHVGGKKCLRNIRVHGKAFMRWWNASSKWLAGFKGHGGSSRRFCTSAGSGGTKGQEATPGITPKEPTADDNAKDDQDRDETSSTRGNLDFADEDAKGDHFPASADVPVTSQEVDNDEGQQTTDAQQRTEYEAIGSVQANLRSMIYLIKFMIVHISYLGVSGDTRTRGIALYYVLGTSRMFSYPFPTLWPEKRQGARRKLELTTHVPGRSGLSTRSVWHKPKATGFMVWDIY